MRKTCLSQYVTVAEAAKMLGITTQGVRKAIAEGRLGGEKLVNGMALIKVSSIKRFRDGRHGND